MKDELNPLYRDIVDRRSTIGVVTAKRGGGKSAFLYRVGEIYHEYTGDNPYVLGFPVEKKHLLPSYFEIAEDIDDLTAAKSYVIVDEGAIFLFARNFQSDINKFFSNLLSISRHYDLSILIATQSMALIDVNILRMLDVLMVRKYSRLAIRFDREEVIPLIYRAQKYIKGRPDLGMVYGDYERDFLIRNPLPSFWCEKISKIWRYMFEMKRKISKQKILEMIYLVNPEIIEETRLMAYILDVSEDSYRKMRSRLYKKLESKYSVLSQASKHSPVKHRNTKEVMVVAAADG